MSRFLPCSLLLVCCGLFASARPVEAQTFTVSVVLNRAQLGKDQSSYQPAVAKTTYAIPAWGKTEDESSLTIEFNSENRFRLLPDSEAEVTTGGESDSGSAWHRVVSLKFGKAAMDHNAGSAPTVHLDCETPTAVCGAVGTEYAVDATHGDYSVTSGHISVSSPDQESALTMSDVEAGGDVTYNPGRENTFSQGSFTGTVRIDGTRFHASDANFTVAKLRDTASETAVHIASGTLGDTGPGDYVMDDGRLKRIDPGSKAATLHPQYLAAAKKEGSLNVERAAYRATGRTFGQEAELKSATAEATRLREELFNRETLREINKQTVQAVEDASRNAGQSAAAAAAASRSAEQSAAAAAQSARNAATSGLRNGPPR